MGSADESRSLCHLNHLIENPESALRPSEWKILVDALEAGTI